MKYQNMICNFLVGTSALAVAQSAHAQDIYQFCSSMSNRNTANGQLCIEIGVRRYTQEIALDACQAIMEAGSSNDGLNCLRSIVDQGFQTDAANLCGSMARINAANAALCMGEIAGSGFDFNAISTAKTIMTIGNSTEALAAVRAIKDQYFSPSAIVIANSIASRNAQNATLALASSAGHFVDQAIESTVLAILRSGSSSNGLDALRNSLDASFDVNAAAFCTRMAAINPQNAAICVSKIRDRSFDTRGIGFCETQMSRGSSSDGLKCIDTLAGSYWNSPTRPGFPNPPARPIGNRPGTPGVPNPPAQPIPPVRPPGIPNPPAQPLPPVQPLPGAPMACETGSNGKIFSVVGQPWETPMLRDRVTASCRADAMTTNSECDAYVTCQDARLPRQSCVSWSNGASFSAIAMNEIIARENATDACRKDARTTNSECDRNVSCSAEGTIPGHIPGIPNPPAQPIQPPFQPVPPVRPPGTPNPPAQPVRPGFPSSGYRELISENRGVGGYGCSLAESILNTMSLQDGDWRTRISISGDCNSFGYLQSYLRLAGPRVSDRIRFVAPWGSWNQSECIEAARALSALRPTAGSPRVTLLIQARCEDGVRVAGVVDINEI